MKKKGMAKGGAMKKKGMAKGGAMKKKGMAKGGAAVKKKGMAAGGAMMKKMVAEAGDALPMKKNPAGEMVPAYAMDGKGKMNKGGMAKKKGYAAGGKVMTYNVGGMVKSSGTLNTGIKKA